MDRWFASLHLTNVASTLAATATAFAVVMLYPKAAQAQYRPLPPAPPPPVYVAPAPPPPPPRAYYYGPGYTYAYGPPPPAPVRYYYADQEPAYALALGADLEGAVPVGVNVPNNGDTIKGGGGFKVRVGEQIRLVGVRFTPEVGFGYDHLWASDSQSTYGWDMNRLFAGARLSVGRVLVPVFYAHVGYGWRQTGDINVSTSNAGGLAYDFGGALDLRLIPHLGLGVHLEYAAIDLPYQPQWVAAGVHADLVF
jgi:hypothetical protein